MGTTEVIGIVATIIGGSVGVKELLVPWLSRKVSERRVAREMHKEFHRDWFGEPAAPGRDAVPGVMQRLNAVDGELRRNGGNSLKDQVVKLNDKVDNMTEQMEEVKSNQNLILQHLGVNEVIPFPHKAS